MARETYQSGTIDQTEFEQVPQVSRKKLNLDLDVDIAWSEIKKVPCGVPDEDGVYEEGVTFRAFENWWKDTAGIVDPDIPVLPEYMVMKISELSRGNVGWQGQHIAEGGSSPRSAARRRWNNLGSRLHTLVDMKRQWGDLHEMYETSLESLYDGTPLPKWIRDPDSGFSTVWDLGSVMFLLYVAASVPLRACFESEVECCSSFVFWFDAMIDIFIADICLNFRTAFYTTAGLREERVGRIAKNYFAGWFCVDFLSCLPLGYVGYFREDGGSPAVSNNTTNLEAVKAGGSNFKAVKAFRLIRLSKMLRLARIKRILSKWGNDVNFQQYINIGFTVFTILFLVHILGCIFYALGTGTETLPTGEIIPGWAVREELEGWCVSLDGGPCDGFQGLNAGVPDGQMVGLGIRYISSLYYCLNALEHGFTTAERGFAICAEFVRDIILGLVASLITSITLSASTGDAESASKLRGLKQWMQAKKIPKSFQAKAMEYFNELWSNRSGVDIDQLLTDMPPAMAGTVSEILYHRFLSAMPLFRNLSSEVIAALCHEVRPLIALKGQVIMKTGSVGREMYMVMQGEVEVGEQQIGGSGGSLEPPGSLS